MSDENKVWEFKDGTKITTSSSESMDYLYSSAPENRPRFPYDSKDPFVCPGGSAGIGLLRKSYSSVYLAGLSCWNMGINTIF